MDPGDGSTEFFCFSSCFWLKSKILIRRSDEVSLICGEVTTPSYVYSGDCDTNKGRKWILITIPDTLDIRNCHLDSLL